MIKRNIKLNILVAVALATVVFGDSTDKKPTSIYNPVGKRDPFKVLNVASTGRKISAIYPTEKYDLEQLNLKAILRIGGKSRVLVEAPDGRTFVIYEGETVGRERATLSRILKTEIIFTQQTSNYLGNPSLVERVVSLPKEELNGILESSVKSGKEQAEGANKAGKKGVKESKEDKTQDNTSLGEVVGQGVGANMQKILNRPDQLEKDLDEAMGMPQK